MGRASMNRCRDKASSPVEKRKKSVAVLFACVNNKHSGLLFSSRKTRDDGRRSRRGPHGQILDGQAERIEVIGDQLVVLRPRAPRRLVRVLTFLTQPAKADLGGREVRVRLRLGFAHRGHAGGQSEKHERKDGGSPHFGVRRECRLVGVDQSLVTPVSECLRLNVEYTVILDGGRMSFKTGVAADTWRLFLASSLNAAWVISDSVT